MTGIRIHSERGDYRYIIGSNLRAPLVAEMGRHSKRSKLFVVYDSNLFALHGPRIRSLLPKLRGRVFEFVIPSGERHKSSRTLEGIHDFLLSNKVARDDFILACGGGVTTDLAGFAASTVLRGVAWGAVPTSLLGMADACIGGKTAINHSRGKNLIGTFWPPRVVLADPQFLITLPARQMVSGFGEIVKTAGLAGGGLIGLCETYVDRGNLLDLGLLQRMIRATAGYKAETVSKDERESGPRQFLNLGHTFGHGIEASVAYGRILHGEAVILGLWAALDLGRRLGFEHKSLSAYKLVVERAMSLVPKRKLQVDPILSAMALDKKRLDADQKYVLLERVGKPVLCDRISTRTVRAVLDSALKRYSAIGGKSAKDFGSTWT